MKISCCLLPATEWVPVECHLTEIATDEWSDSQNPTLLTPEGKNNLINANLKSDLAGESQKAQSLSTPLTRRPRKGELWAYGFNIGMRFTFRLYTSLGSDDRTQVGKLVNLSGLITSIAASCFLFSWEISFSPAAAALLAHSKHDCGGLTLCEGGIALEGFLSALLPLP